MMPSKPQFVGERVKLGDVVAAVPGRNADLHCNAVYSVTNSQGFVPSEEYFSKDVFSKDLKSYRVVKRNMIAYNPSRINVGSVALQDKEDEVVVSPLYVIFSTDERKVLPDYVVRFLKSKPGLDQIAFRSIGTVRNNLKFKALCQMTIKLPSLEEQQSRLSNLRSIQNQIDRANRQLAALDSLVKSRFVEMFGDPVSNPKKLRTRPGSALFKIGNGKTKPMSERRETGYPAYGGNGVSWYSQQSLTYSPTIIIGRVGRHCGNTRLVNKPCWVTDNAMYIKQFRDNELNLIYLDELMQIVDFNRYADKGDLWKITQRPFMEFNYPLPPLPLQQEFADFVAQVDKSRFLHQASAKVRGNKLQSSFTSDIGSTFSRRLSLQEGLTLG